MAGDEEMAGDEKAKEREKEKEQRREEKERKERRNGGATVTRKDVTATTLRSGLRAPKSRPVSMPGYRHSFEKRTSMLYTFVVLRVQRRSDPLRRSAE